MSRQSKKRRQQEQAEKEELLSPDAFVQQGTGWATYVQKHFALILGGLGALLLAIIAAEYMASSSQSAASADTAALIQAVDEYQEAVYLNAILTSTSSFGDQKRYTKARDGFSTILNGASSPPAGVKGLASLYDASLALRLGLFDEALTGYERYLNETAEPDTISYFALEGKGYALEGLERLDEALAVFQKIEVMDRFSDFGLKHVARVLLKKGDSSGAKAALQQIVDRDPPSPLREFAEQQLAQLE